MTPQELWEEDQLNGNGLLVAQSNAKPSGGDIHGYVRIDRDEDDRGKLIKKVSIPEGKQRCYELLDALYKTHNFGTSLNPESAKKLMEIVEEVKMTALYKLVADGVSNLDDKFEDAWFSAIKGESVARVAGHGGRDGFETMSKGVRNTEPGFLPVILGMVRGGRLLGHHFWHKYWYDQNRAKKFKYSGHCYDELTYAGGADTRVANGLANPHFLNAEYSFELDSRPVHKPCGSMFMGCSLEFILLLGVLVLERHNQGGKGAAKTGSHSYITPARIGLDENAPQYLIHYSTEGVGKKGYTRLSHFFPKDFLPGTGQDRNPARPTTP